MTSKTFLAILLVAVLSFSFGGFVQGQRTRSTWEYKFLVITGGPTRPIPDQEKILNQHGAEGWEIALKEGDGVYLLRRSK